MRAGEWGRSCVPRGPRPAPLPTLPPQVQRKCSQGERGAGEGGAPGKAGPGKGGEAGKPAEPSSACAAWAGPSWRAGAGKQPKGGKARRARRLEGAGCRQEAGGKPHYSLLHPDSGTACLGAEGSAFLKGRPEGSLLLSYEHVPSWHTMSIRVSLSPLPTWQLAKLLPLPRACPEVSEGDRPSRLTSPFGTTHSTGLPSTSHRPKRLGTGPTRTRTYAPHT
jgi:hypothetical protein